MVKTEVMVKVAKVKEEQMGAEVQEVRVSVVVEADWALEDLELEGAAVARV